MKKRLGFDLILLGDPTSGKDTQALLLAKRYRVILARSGKYLRSLRNYKYRHGAPAPTNLIIPFLNHFLKLAKNQDLIFVGAARLKPEAQYLVKQLKSQGRGFFAVYIKLPKSEVIKRSLTRAERLEDKDLSLINNRIAYFKNQVSKTVDYYKKMDKLKFINGKQSIKKVTQDIQKAIYDYQKSKRS